MVSSQRYCDVHRVRSRHLRGAARPLRSPPFPTAQNLLQLMLHCGFMSEEETRQRRLASRPATLELLVLPVVQQSSPVAPSFRHRSGSGRIEASPREHF